MFSIAVTIPPNGGIGHLWVEGQQCAVALLVGAVKAVSAPLTRCIMNTAHANGVSGLI